MSLSLTDEILDPTKARSLEWSNSAFGLGQVPIRPFGNAPFAKMGAQEFRNVRSKVHFPVYEACDLQLATCDGW
jgi:hypothetical protein